MNAQNNITSENDRKSVYQEEIICLGGALLAANLLKSMSTYAAQLEEGDLSVELNEQSK